jgi:phage terminase small subunit
MKGRLPTPTAIRVLEGVRGHRPLRREPVAVGLPAKPSWLKGPPADIWRGLVPQLIGSGLVHKVDEIGLANLCTTWASLIETDRELTQPQKRDDPRLQRRSNQLRGLLLPQLREFGLTPGSRSRLAPPAPPADDTTMGGLLR